ncbi:MAG: hypothetical protein JJ864_14075 [Rhizobiaceae bacterium]|nr:hypothetical protein [Rhizobiaceae bacterium]
MASKGNPGFFRSAFNAIVAAQERQAQRYVNSSLMLLDDETLRANGISRAQLAAGRRFTSII